LTDHRDAEYENRPRRSGSVLVSRNVLIAGSSAIVVLLIVVGTLSGLLLAKGSSDVSSAAISTSTPTTRSPDPTPFAPSASAPTMPIASQTPPTPPEVPVLHVGDAATNFGVTLTISSVEIVDSIETISGPPIVAEPGTQLVLFKATFLNNTSVPVDLSCASPLWMNVYDTEGRKLAPVFDTYRIPGNQECNYQLIQGLSSEWNFAFKGVAGATLSKLTFLDTDARSPGDPEETVVMLS
jgi:hypothetical protein